MTDKVSTLSELLADTRSTRDLVAAAIEGLEVAGYSQAIVVLQARGTKEVLDEALTLCDDADRSRQVLGIQILSELGSPDRTFPEECCDRLLRFLWTARKSKDIALLETVLYALGHVGSRSSDASVADLHRSPDARIRRAVAFALCGASDAGSVGVLLRLIRDPNEGVRDWATTGIGGFADIDGDDIRNALLERALDSDHGVRAEAHLGLARRKDRRVVPLLIEMLENQGRSPDENAFAYYFRDAAKIYLGIDEEEEIGADVLSDALTLRSD